MFISCGGIRVLVDMLNEDFTTHQDLVLTALSAIRRVFDLSVCVRSGSSLADLQSLSLRDDLCRLFVREGLLDPLSTTLLSVVKNSTTKTPAGEQACAITLIFAQVAQKDVKVQTAFIDRTILRRKLCISTKEGRLAHAFRPASSLRVCV